MAMRPVIKSFVFFFVLFICQFCVAKSAHFESEGVKVEYELCDESKIKNFFFPKNENIRLLSDDTVYVVGHVSRVESQNADDLLCQLIFFSEGRRGLKRIANVGWISCGKFFILELGSRDLYGDDLICELEVKMRK